METQLDFPEAYIRRELASLQKSEEGTAQHTRSANRIEALLILKRIVRGEKTDLCEAALAEPKIASLLRGLQTVRAKYDPGTMGYERMDLCVRQMETAYGYLEALKTAFETDGLCAVLQLRERKNQIWFSKDNPLLQGLDGRLKRQNRRVIVLWGFSLAEEAALELKRMDPNESRPLAAVEAGRLWAQGRIRMPEARRAILACHAMAKEKEGAEALLCHAVGQGVSVVHTQGHALGLPMYELTAIALREGFPACRGAVEERVRIYEQRLSDCIREEKENAGPWASFLGQEKRLEEMK